MSHSDEFVARFGELTYGQQRLVEDSITMILAVEDPDAYGPPLGATHLLLLLEPQGESKLVGSIQSLEENHDLPLNWNTLAGLSAETVTAELCTHHW